MIELSDILKKAHANGMQKIREIWYYNDKAPDTLGRKLIDSCRDLVYVPTAYTSGVLGYITQREEH